MISDAEVLRMPKELDVFESIEDLQELYVNSNLLVDLPPSLVGCSLGSSLT